MRVLYLSPVGTLGGAERSLLDVLESVKAAKPEWSLAVIAGGEGPLVARTTAAGVSVDVISLPKSLASLGDSGVVGTGLRRVWFPIRCLRAGFDSLAYIVRLRRAVRQFKPDLIHTNGFKMHVFGLWARVNSTPVIWHVRDYISSRPVMKRLLRLHAGRCSAAIAISRSVERDIQKICGPRLRTHCIYNVVDLSHYCQDGANADLDALAKLPPAPAGTVRVGLPATMARWKGHEVFLKAVCRLSHNLQWRAYIIGGAIYGTTGSQWSLEQLRAQAAALNIADRVGFTGFVSDSAAAIRALDIVVHASTEPEPFGRVIAEAMGCGRAVITSANGGAGELIDEGRDALIHPPGDAVTLAERIEQLIRDPELRASMGNRGRMKAERCFARPRLVSELLPVYRSVLGRIQTNPESSTHPIAKCVE